MNPQETLNRSGRGWRRGIVLAALATVFALPAVRAELALELDGQVELRATYDTNVLLTADDLDFELRRFFMKQLFQTGGDLSP